MAGTDTSLGELCDLIRPDLAFSAEILRIANSPLVAFSKEITNVLQASMLLGFRRLRSVVITVGLRAYLSESFTPLFESCWHHSVACAMIAERAAKACSYDTESAYSAGVMHDIGRVALAVSLPEAYERVVERSADYPRDLLRRERELCGIDHCEAGGRLVMEWGLPEVFCWIASCHHDIEARAAGAGSLVPLSCLLADALGFGVVSYRGLGSYSEILNEFPEAARSNFPTDGEKLAKEIGDQITLIESV